MELENNGIYKVVMCDRCGKQIFRKFLKTEGIDGGWTKVDHFEPVPTTWGWHEGKKFCPECTAEYEKLFDDFMRKHEQSTQ